MSTVAQSELDVAFFRPSISDAEINEVIACLRSGWLTTGPRVQEFEDRFARAVGAEHAVAVNSCTAALHLSVEALKLRRGQGVLVPSMTFAATAEVVRYQGAVPILVDCDPKTLHMDLRDAERKLHDLRHGRGLLNPKTKVVGMIPVHVGGLMMDLAALHCFAKRHGLWLVEDAAHAFPAAYRKSKNDPWRHCGQGTADVTCYSFYANKTITTGEGGMVVTGDKTLARRIRTMSLHGLSRQSWKRHKGGGFWDYGIVAPGYKYNLPDIAAALGIQQLERAESMRRQREALALEYREGLRDLEQLNLPTLPRNRIHAWHLYPIRLRLKQLKVNRNAFIDHLRRRGVGCSVHWRPLHLHPYYRKTFGWKPSHFPVASSVWKKLVSLPLFPSMVEREQQYVIDTVRELCLSLAVETRVNGNGRPRPR